VACLHTSTGGASRHHTLQTQQPCPTTSHALKTTCQQSRRKATRQQSRRKKTRRPLQRTTGIKQGKHTQRPQGRHDTATKALRTVHKHAPSAMNPCKSSVELQKIDRYFRRKYLTIFFEKKQKKFSPSAKTARTSVSHADLQQCLHPGHCIGGLVISGLCIGPRHSWQKPRRQTLLAKASAVVRVVYPWTTKPTSTLGSTERPPCKRICVPWCADAKPCFATNARSSRSRPSRPTIVRVAVPCVWYLICSLSFSLIFALSRLKFAACAV